MVTTFESYRQSRYFPALDGIRAISILLVMTVHLYYQNFSWKWLSGDAGVTIFFVLSGYLITMLAIREEEQSGQLNLKSFYIRRSFRIFPPYFFVLFLYCLLIFGLGFGGDNDQGRLLTALPYYLFYLNEFAPAAPFYQSWSLGIEEKFYLCWPVLAFVVLKKSFYKRLFFAGGVAILLFVVNSYFPQTLLIHYYAIALGCLLAIFLANEKIFNRLRFLCHQKWAVGVWLAFVTFHLSMYPFPNIKEFYPVMVALLLLGITMSPPRWLAWRPLVYIGERSYGIYLVHILCLRTVKLVFPVDTPHLWVSIFGLVTGTMLAIFISEILYRFLERPLIAYGRRLLI